MKHIISIGIDKAKGLIPLGAAVSGANEFVEWGKSQGYSTSLFIDDGKNVSQSEIFDEVNNVIENKNCEKLIIFFSGHGVLKSPSQEIWLLSNAAINPNESINLTGSIDYARTSGIPYIVFISDACRVLPTELSFTGNGSEIFPIRDDSDQDCYIDVLYATRPGNPALEQNSKNNSKKFGLLTQTIVEILKGNYPELIKVQNNKHSLIDFYDSDNLKVNISYKSLSTGKWYINTINSESSIKSIVREKARKISLKLEQSPDIRIQYQNPKPSLAEFDDGTAKNLLLSTYSEVTDGTSSDEHIVEDIQYHIKDSSYFEYNSQYYGNNKNFRSILEDSNAISPMFSIDHLESNLIKNSELIYDSKGRESFETQTGFTIIGLEIKDLLANCDKQIFSENNNQQIRMFPIENSNSALIILKNGNSIPVAILNGYIGTLVFDKNQLLTVNYTPSRNNHKYNSFKRNENKINFVRAFVASAANEGLDYSKTFRNEFIEGGRFNYSDAGSYLRQEKSIDPSLGLYAVYAYMQEGKFKEIKSVYRYMQMEDGNMIFDVAMLSNMLKNERGKLAPFCPMIAIGWAYRQKFEHFLHTGIVKASNFLVPSLWTTFDKEGTEILVRLFSENQIS